MIRTMLSDTKLCEFIQSNIGKLPSPFPKPVLVILSGPPGSGKSHFSRALFNRMPIAIIESDTIRKSLFRPQTYSAMESKWLFTFCHSMIKYLMTKSIPVLFDATNLLEANREHLYKIVDASNGLMVIIKVEAPEELIYERLIQRENILSIDDNSSATWTIYRRMVKSMEPIKRKHLSVDTSKDINPMVETIVCKIKKSINN